MTAIRSFSVPAVLLAFLLLRAAVVPAAAQDREDGPGQRVPAFETPVLLDIQEAWRLMEESNPVLRRLSIDQAAALRTLESKSDWIPALTLRGGVNRNSPLVGQFTDPAGKTEADYWSANLNLEFRFSFNPNLGLDEKIRAANFNIALLQRENTLQSLKAELLKLFYQIESGEESLRMQERSLALAEERLSQMRLQYEQGRRSELELLSARIAVARYQSSLQKTRGDQEKRLLTLRDNLRLSPDHPIALIYPEKTGETESESPSDLLALLSGNRDLKIAGLQLELTETNARLNRRKTLGPTLGLSLGTNLGWSATLNQMMNNQIWESKNWTDTLSLGLTLSVPIDPRIKGSSDWLSLKQNEDTLEKSRLALEEDIRSRETSLRRLLLDLDLSRTNLELNRLSLDLQEQNLAKLQESYNAGRTSLLDLEDARRDLMQTQLDLETEELNRRLLLLDLKLLLGRELSGF